ncbi:MAG: DNA-processing protein DprA [Parcubacteria group bacterium]|jgi:DNA processing protein
MSISRTPSLSDHSYVNAFNVIPGIGAQKLFLLSNYFDSFADAWIAPVDQLIETGFSPKLADSVVAYRSQIDPSATWQRVAQSDAQLLTVKDPRFPVRLREIDHPPFCLYVRGNIDLLSSPSVAIVGSRKVSEYGTRATTLLAGEITRSGITIVSGLALGTDALAHRATLENNGPTIAVIAGGVDDDAIAPRSHLSLARKILARGGAIISEYPIGTTPSRGTFPARNRLMAGLSVATIIIEAAKDSGTLITAAHASQFQRKVFVVPGSIFATHAYGSNHLLRNNIAKPVLCANDVLCLFHKNKKYTGENISPTFSSTEEKDLYEHIKKYPDGIQINRLIKESPLDTITISSTLTMLEIGGTIKNIGNQTYVVT